jgi:hypothetical protein
VTIRMVVDSCMLVTRHLRLVASRSSSSQMPARLDLGDILTH